MDDVQKIAAALRQVFGEQVNEGRFIDTTKIPFICKDIQSLRENMEEMNKNLKDNFVTQDQYWPVKTLVYGLVALLLTGMVTAIVMLVLKQ